MRKFLCMMIIAVMAAGILTACGNSGSGSGNKETGTDAPATNAQTASVQEDIKADDTDAKDNDAAADEQKAGKYTFVYKGINIDMKAEAAPICEALGEYKSYNEETSCAFDGLDKSYTYSSFILTTYPDGDIDRVNSVVVLDDTVSTVDGICIGDSKEKVEETYGADSFDGINSYIMIEGDASLTIIMDSDKVYSIQYNAKFE